MCIHVYLLCARIASNAVRFILVIKKNRLGEGNYLLKVIHLEGKIKPSTLPKQAMWSAEPALSGVLGQA
jgi:hypothetical protein